MSGATTPAPVTSAPDNEFLQLDPRSIDLDRVTWWIATVCISGVLMLAAIVTLFTSSAEATPAALFATWAVVTLGHIWLTLRWPAKVYHHTRYRVDERGIEIHRGVFWRHRIAVPRSRVQHIDVTQGPLQRSRGLGTLVLFTAGTAHSRVTLAGVAYPAALALRDRLLPQDDDDAL